MRILNQNKQLILASDESATYVLVKPTMKPMGKYEESFKLGCLQYSTGIAALCRESFIIIYDFRYKKKIYQIDTYQKVVKVILIKNLLIAASKQRILFHDLLEKVNLNRVNTCDGQNLIANHDYYNLKILYPISEVIYEQQELWTSKITKIQAQKASQIIYDSSGEIMAFVDDNVVSLYQKQQILRGCSFNSDIQQILKGIGPHQFYIKTFGGGKNDEPIYVKLTDQQKSFLKLNKETQEQVQTSSGCSGKMLIHKEKMIVWAGKCIYDVEVDQRPEFFEAKKPLTQIINQSQMEPDSDIQEDNSQKQAAE